MYAIRSYYVSPVMTCPVFHKPDQRTPGRTGWQQAELSIQNVADTCHDLDIFFFVIAADIVTSAVLSFFDNPDNSLTVVLNVKPVPNVPAVAVDRQLTTFPCVVEHQGNQLFGKLVRPIRITSYNVCYTKLLRHS